MNNFEELKIKMDSLAVFSDIKNDNVIQALRRLLDTFDVAAYSDFVSALYPYGSDLSKYISGRVLEDDNFYIRRYAAGEEISPEIQNAVKSELEILEEIAAISSSDIQNSISEMHFSGGLELPLPRWTCSPVNLAYDFARKIADIAKTGYGIFARYTFFRLDEGEIIPVAHPDFQSLDTLFGYERERDLIVRNTRAFLDGGGASNMLLYGDMGTGKSSTIKAVAAEYAPQGLRIIEIKKSQLFQIPDVMDALAANPLKFILFIDDLSFAGNDDNFSALKAALEGSISGCADNTVIYATSNRRHLVRESASDRVSGAGFDDDLHLNDTLQETMSLAARFGLTITFSKPDKDEYLSIVRSLADEYGIDVSDEEELFRKAEAFAIRRNGRSPRTARQFIELQKIGL